MQQLVGRQREIDTAVGHLAHVLTVRSARMVVVDGSSGIGKSSVLLAVRGRLVGQGHRVVRIGLTAAESSLSWAGLINLCAQLDPAALRDLPSAQRRALYCALGAQDGAAEPMLVAAALARALENDIEAHGALLLEVDDLQWLDQATASALAFAVKSSAQLPLAVLMAARLERRPLEPERLLPDDQVLHVGLHGLSLIDLQELLAKRFGVVHRRPDLLRIHEVCGGNVLHAIEIGRMTSAGHSLEEALVPHTLQAAIDADLSCLPSVLREVLELVALLARPSVEVVERMLPGAETQLVDAEAAGIIEERDGRLLFVHPLVRAGLLDRLGGLRRRQLQRRLAEVVSDPDERVGLLAAAATGPDEQIAGALESAGDAAAERGATHVAAERYERALELTSSGSPPQARRALRAAVCHLEAGDIRRAEPLYRAAIDAGLPPDLEATAVIGLSAILAEVSGLVETEKWLRSAGSRLRHHPAAWLRVTLQLVAVQFFVDQRQSVATAGQAVTEARAIGDVESLAKAETLLCSAQLLTGQPVDLDALSLRLTALGLDAGDDRPNGTPVVMGQLLVWTDRIAEAIENEQAELRRSIAAGHVPAEARAQQGLAEAYRRCGRWDDAQAALERWAELTALTGSDPAADATYTDLAWLHAARGRHDEAKRVVASSLELTKENPIWQMHARANAGFVDFTRGGFDEAARHFQRARTLAEEIGYKDLGSLPFRDTAVEVLLALGRVQEATTEAELLSERAMRANRARGQVIAARARGLVAAAAGDLVAATAAVEEALAFVAEVADPFARARVLQLAGTVSRRAGRRTEAREQLEEAQRLFEALQAAPFVERAQGELQRLGARTGRTDLLTRTERQVAELVCDGRSNGEVSAVLFVTTRTVEAHLTRVYRKLGVRSRSELIARRSLLPDGE